jgi:endonuclease I
MVTMKFSISLIFSLLFLPVLILGQGTYYNTLTPSNSSFVTDLKSRIRSPYTRIAYAQFDETNVTSFASRDTAGGQRVVTCVYSGENFVFTAPFAWGTFSREHTWCHSWMPSNPTESSDEYADQHHLFPTNQNNANGRRSNHPLGIVANASYTYLLGKLGTNSAGETVYEPRDEHKGDAARALLYMSVRYDGIGGYNWTFNNLNSVILPGQGIPEDPQSLQMLLDWHRQDPPSKWEVDRNDYIEGIQKNRNPFTDHPEYVAYINFNDLTKLSPSYSTEPANQPTTLSISSPSSTSLSVSWTASVTGAQAPSGYLVEIYNSNDYFIPIDGSSYSDDTNIADSKGLKNVMSGTSYTFTGLSASTTYYVRVYPYNGTSTAVNYKLDGTVITGSGTTGAVSPYATEPANHPTNLAQGSVTSSSIQITWTASVAGAQAPSGYLLKASSTNSFSDPVDGIVYSDDAVLSDNSAAVNLTSSDVSYTFSSLPSSTTYYFKIYPYNGTGTQRNYKTDGTVASVSAATSAPPLATEPANHPTNFNQGTITSSSIQLTWTASAAGAQAPSGYLLLASVSNSITSPTDGTVVTDDTNLSDNSAAVNLSSSDVSYSFTGLSPATTYYFKLFPYNGTGTLRNYKTDGSISFQFGQTLGSAVTTPPVVVNEYWNGSNTSTEWVELLVLDDNVDMRGMRLRDYTNAGNANTGITFSNHTLWSSVQKGSFIVILGGSNLQTQDYSFTGDKAVIIGGTNPTYFSGSSIDVSATNDAIELLSSAGAHIYSLGHGPYAGLIADIPQPKASVAGSSSSGKIVRFINVSTKQGFLDSTKVQHSDTVNATQGTWNDSAESTLVVNTLPVELVSFRAAADKNAVFLTWATATETSNHGFEIEKLSNSNMIKFQTSTWEKIGFVEGNGTTSSPREYSFVDRSVSAGEHRYRLKQIDRDGSFEYSPSVEVTVVGAPLLEALVRAYPNPFNPASVITYSVPAAADGAVTQLQVFDVMGREVALLVNGPVSAGTHSVLFNAASLSSGAYLCVLRAGPYSASSRLLLMK